MDNNSIKENIRRIRKTRKLTQEEMAQLLVDEYGIDMELAMTDSGNLMKSWEEAGIAE